MKYLLMLITLCFVSQNCNSPTDKQTTAWNESVTRSRQMCDKIDSFIALGKLDVICRCGEKTIDNQRMCDSTFNLLSKEY